MRVNIVLHPIPNSFNGIQIRRVSRPKNDVYTSFFQLFLCIACCMARNSILHKLKIGIQSNPPINYRDNVIAIRFLFNRAPFLLPKQAKPLCSAIETLSKHPTTSSSNLINNTRLVKFLTRATRNVEPRISAASYPYLIRP